MTDPARLLLQIVRSAAVVQKKVDLWLDADFAPVKELELDQRGEIGEQFICLALQTLGHEVKTSQTTDPTMKHWDLLVDGTIKLEVKTATLGKTGTFQHENLEKDRNYDGLVLVDIAPNDLYTTFAAKSTLPFTTANSNWSINKKKMHRRRGGIQYKWDLSLKDASSRKIETLKDLEAQYNTMARTIEKEQA